MTCMLCLLKCGVDNHMRIELEVSSTFGVACGNRFCLSQTRLVHTKPYELLLPMKTLSPATEKMIKHFTEYAAISLFFSSTQPRLMANLRHSHTEHRMRTERFNKPMAYTDAFALLSKFYTETHANASESFKKGKSVPHA